MELKRWLGNFCPDYDSTKANFDELEARIKGLETMEIDTEKRLTALESKISDHVNNIWHGPYKDAEVDAPKASSNTWNVVSWKQCLKCGTWYCRSHNCDPDTCGNCKKPARWDDSPDTVVCDQETGLHYKSVQSGGCPHHERREEA